MTAKKQTSKSQKPATKNTGSGQLTEKQLGKVVGGNGWGGSGSGKV
jgi:hypothetical protein